MAEKVKTDIGCYFRLPDFLFRGHPNHNTLHKSFDLLEIARPTFEKCNQNPFESCDK